MRKTLPALAALLTLTALTTGCTSDPDPQTTTTGPDWSAANHNPTPTPTPSPLSEEDQAVVDAKAALQKHEDVWLSCLKDPPNSLPTCFDEVSVGLQLQGDRLELEDWQRQGRHIVGNTTLTATTLSVDLPGKSTDPDQGAEATASAIVVFDACRDLTGVDLTNAAGESQLPDDFDRHPRFRITVINDSYPEVAGWRVGQSVQDLETQACG